MEGPAGRHRGEHIDDDVLEQYALDRLTGDQLAATEEHLLLCGYCRDRLEQLDAFVASLRTAIQNPALDPPRRGSAQSRVRGGFHALWAVTAAAAAVIGVGYFSPSGPGVREPATVEMRAMRGEPSAGVAPAKTPLVLRLDATGLPSADIYRVEVVDYSGASRWNGDVRLQSGMLVAQTPGMPPGMYWVRAIDPARPETLREYGLTLK
jgi:hypothetical protein